MSPARDETGRGAALLSASTGLAAFAAFILHLVLGRTLGAADYGRFGFVMSVLIWVELSTTQGLPYAASRSIAGAAHRARPIARATAWAAVIVGALSALALVAASPLIARAAGDAPLAPLVAWAALDVIPFGLLNVRLFAFNGLRRYGLHAALFGGYVAIRVAAMVAFVLLGFGVAGALWGNALGSALVAAVALRLALPGDGPTPSLRPILLAAAPLSAFHLMSHLFQHVDLWLVTGLLPTGELTGHYVAAHTIARTPPFLCIGISLALFPAVSAALAENAPARAADLVRRALARELALLPGAVALLAAAPERVMTLLFGPAFAPAAPFLPPLVLAMSVMALLLTAAHAVAATAAPRHAAIAMAATATLAAAVAAAAIAATGRADLAPLGPLTAGLLGVTAICAGLRRAWGASVVPRRELLLAPLAGAAVFALLRYAPAGGLLFWPQAAAAGLAYLIALARLRALADLPQLLAGRFGSR